MSDIYQRIADLEREVAELKKSARPLTWVGKPVFYCSGYIDCCEYRQKTISKVDTEKFRVKVKCEHQSEWADFETYEGMAHCVEGWVKDGRERIENPDNYY